MKYQAYSKYKTPGLFPVSGRTGQGTISLEGIADHLAEVSE